MKRAAIGEKVAKRTQWEAQQARTLEGVTDKDGRLTSLGLFSLHHVDWVHFETVITSRGTLKAGFPDYYLMGKDWSAYLEIKARNLETGKLSSGLSANQRRFHERLREVGHEVWTAYLPDDLQAVNKWLREKTGVVCSIDGLTDSVCPRKNAYGTKLKAMAVARDRMERGSEQLYVYPCPLCRLWHLTSHPGRQAEAVI